jgi:hypothetical protein
MEKTRRRGYAVDDEELEEGLRCIAVPLLDAQRLPVAAVSISGPSFRVTAQKLPTIANQLLQCVRGIAADMGYTSVGRANRAAGSAEVGEHEKRDGLGMPSRHPVCASARHAGTDPLC